MAAEILTVDTGQDASGDVVVVAGTPLTVSLKGTFDPTAIRSAQVNIEIKGDDDAYYPVGALATDGQRSVVIIGPGTYRFIRPESSAECGVFSA